MITRDNTKTIYDLTANAGALHGDKIFLRWEDNDVIREVSFKEFSAQCAAIASWTRAQEARLGRKIHVALLGGSSNHYLAVLLGVMCAGSVSVPLDIQVSLETLCDCLDRSDVDVLFYDWEHRALAEGAKERCPGLFSCISFQHGRHVLCSDNLLKEYMGQTIQPQAGPDDLAMILFTSGTTGKGKGVMLSHGNLIDNTFCTTETGDVSGEVYLNVLPIHHVFCINGDILLPLRYGYTICLNQSLSKLADHLLLFAPTAFRAVPMIAKALYSRIAVMAKQQPDRPIQEIKEAVLGPRLHRIISGGGYLAPELAKNFQDLGISIAQGYGMSECSPKISSPDWSRPDKIASVGRVVEGCQVRIVDDEIQVKSPSVMMGYYKDPENTAQALTEDGWLRTGDIGYVDEEQFLYLTGRKKNLIILSNGENVAPEQIENMFEGERLIEDILVYEEDDAIAAEVYPNFKYAQAAGSTDIEGSIRQIIAEHNQALPSYKRILKFHLRDVPFEKTSSKKIIRSRYFSQKKAQEEKEAAFRQPETKRQKELADLIAASLGHRRFGIDTNLYEAGLDSLGSVMLLSDLASQLHLNLTLDTLMSHPTILQLEALLGAVQNQPAVDYSPRPVYPLTNLQIYFAYVMRGNTTANLPFLFRLDPSVDLARLKEAVVALFDLHPGLKSIIQLDNGAYKNFRDDSRAVSISIETLTDSQWEELRPSLLKPYYYGDNEPLYHIGIYQTDSANYLFFDIAHIVGDGMTMNILFEDLNALYLGQPVEKESYTLYEYVLDEKNREARGLRERDIAYFQGLMKDFRIRKSILNRRDFHDLDHGIDAALKDRFGRLNLNKVKAFCRENGVSENVLFLTAFNYCIGIFSGEKDAISTSIHSGRTDGRWIRLAGPLFLTYLFRYTVIPHETVPELLRRAGKQVMESMRCHISTIHGDEMFFQYQGDILNINEIGGAPAERLKIQLDALPFHLQVFSDSQGYYYELRYWENRFDRDQLAVFMTCMERIVEAMLEEPSARRLKSHLPENVFPKHYFIKASVVNRTAGFRLIPEIGWDMEVKAYVLDDACRKQPFGGWGNLYIMDHPTLGWKDKVTNPYGPGILYQTGLTARILPDGTLDLLEQGGRTVMMERLTGRCYVDLYALERLLSSLDGIHRAEAYVRWGEEHKLVLTANLYCSQAPQLDRLNEYLKQHWDEKLLPIDFRVIRD